MLTGPGDGPGIRGADVELAHRLRRSPRLALARVGMHRHGGQPVAAARRRPGRPRLTADPCSAARRPGRRPACRRQASTAPRPGDGRRRRPLRGGTPRPGRRRCRAGSRRRATRGPEALRPTGPRAMRGVACARAELGVPAGIWHVSSAPSRGRHSGLVRRARPTHAAGDGQVPRLAPRRRLGDALDHAARRRRH